MSTTPLSQVARGLPPGTEPPEETEEDVLGLEQHVILQLYLLAYSLLTKSPYCLSSCQLAQHEAHNPMSPMFCQQEPAPLQPLQKWRCGSKE